MTRLLRSPKIVIGLCLAGVFGIVAIIGPLIAPFSPNTSVSTTLSVAQPPSAAHLLGTTQVQQDVLSQLLVGGRSTILVSLVAGVAATVLAPFGGSGLPILGLTLRYTDGLAAIERSRFAGMTGREVPPWPADPRRRYRWAVIPSLAAFTGRATWGKICYPLPRLLASALLFPIVVAFWAVGLATLPLALPFYLWTNPPPALEDLPAVADGEARVRRRVDDAAQAVLGVRADGGHRERESDPPVVHDPIARVAPGVRHIGFGAP